MSLTFQQEYQPLEHRLTGMRLGRISLERRPQFFSAPNMNQTSVKRRYLHTKNLKLSKGVLNLDRTMQLKLQNNTNIYNDNSMINKRFHPAVRPSYPMDKMGDTGVVGFYANPSSKKVGVPKLGDRRRNRAQDGAPIYGLGLSTEKIRGSAETIRLFLFNNQIPKVHEPERFENELTTGFLASGTGRESATYIRSRAPNQRGLEDSINSTNPAFRRDNPIRHPRVVEAVSSKPVKIEEIVVNDIASVRQVGPGAHSSDELRRARKVLDRPRGRGRLNKIDQIELVKARTVFEGAFPLSGRRSLRSGELELDGSGIPQRGDLNNFNIYSNQS